MSKNIFHAMTRATALVLTVCLCAATLLFPCTFAAGNDYGLSQADALNKLGLFLGTDKGYELENTLTREQSITMVVRLMGKEDTALGKKWDHPFTDLSSWAEPYVGYAYSAGVTLGRSATLFGGGNDACTDVMFLTFILRLLGYRDTGDNADFVWDDPYALAEQTGIWDEGKTDPLTRADTVVICWNALMTHLKGSEKTLADELLADGAYTKADYDEALVIAGESEAEAEEPAEITPVMPEAPEMPEAPKAPDSHPVESTPAVETHDVPDESETTETPDTDFPDMPVDPEEGLGDGF